MGYGFGWARVAGSAEKSLSRLKVADSCLSFAESFGYPPQTNQGFSPSQRFLPCLSGSQRSLIILFGLDIQAHLEI
jgi:hypothetical protein